MAHCNDCCLRLPLTKTRVLPKHYSAETHGWWSYGEQKECSASGTDRYTAERDMRGGCRRTHSGQRCPCCQRVLKLNKNGKFPKHSTVSGDKCELSQANSR
jgi:hypothetical protein